MTYEQIRFESDGPVAVITIAREQVRNALSDATTAEILAALLAVEQDDALRVAIITGVGGRAFAAGADIGELRALPSADAARRSSEASHRVGLAIAAMRKPVIAAINGYALGGGLELAICCDIRLAADTAKLGQPEINLGLIPGWGGTQRLPRLVGPAAAKLLCLTGEMIDAQEALRLGLVERVLPVAELMDAARALARQIAAKAPLAIAAIKQAIDRGLDMPLAAGCMYEAALFGAVAASEDAKEGTAAFLEKRQATWKGR
jgi:enoyl-CoA hydratase